MTHWDWFFLIGTIVNMVIYEGLYQMNKPRKRNGKVD
jgi:hypothetical protein